MNFHPVAELFPRMPEAELTELAKDIEKSGLKEKIWIDPDGRIIDGRHRFLACERVGVEPEFQPYDEDEHGPLLQFILSLNLQRRHLTAGQRGLILEKLREHNYAMASLCDEFAAQLMGVSHDTIKRTREVQSNGVPDLIKQVEQGDVSIRAASDISKLQKEEQEELIKKGPKAIREKAKELRTPQKQNTSDSLICPKDDLKEALRVLMRHYGGPEVIELVDKIRTLFPTPDPLAGIELPEKLQTDAAREALSDWLLYKKQKGQTYKPIALKTLIKKVSEWSEETLVKAVEDSIASNYAGLFPPKGTNPSFAPYKTIAQREAELLAKYEAMDDEDE